MVALWARGNPLTLKNQTTLHEQINTISFLAGSHITYLPPNKLCKMLGIHINQVMHFRKHFTSIAQDVRKLAKALTNRKLSPPNKTMVI